MKITFILIILLLSSFSFTQISKSYFNELLHSTLYYGAEFDEFQQSNYITTINADINGNHLSVLKLDKFGNTLKEYKSESFGTSTIKARVLSFKVHNEESMTFLLDNFSGGESTLSGAKLNNGVISFIPLTDSIFETGSLAATLDGDNFIIYGQSFEIPNMSNLYQLSFDAETLIQNNIQDFGLHQSTNSAGDDWVSSSLYKINNLHYLALKQNTTNKVFVFQNDNLIDIAEIPGFGKITDFKKIQSSYLATIAESNSSRLIRLNAQLDIDSTLSFSNVRLQGLIVENNKIYIPYQNISGSSSTLYSKEKFKVFDNTLSLIEDYETEVYQSTFKTIQKSGKIITLGLSLLQASNHNNTPSGGSAGLDSKVSGVVFQKVNAAEELNQSTEYFVNMKIGNSEFNFGGRGVVGHFAANHPYSFNKAPVDCGSFFGAVGLDINGNKVVTNSEVSDRDYFIGPYMNPSEYNEVEISKYRAPFYVTREMLEYHKQHYDEINYVIPTGIKNWPAHGDVSKGQLPNIAPFFDFDQNGIYEPLNGDYPAIPGRRCYTFIVHQSEIDNGLPIHSQLMYQLYDFECGQSEALDNAYFLKATYTAIENDYSDLYFGLVSSLASDHERVSRSGTNVELGSVYTYKPYGLLDTISGWTAGSASAITVLKGVALENDNFDNSIGAGTNESINGLGFNDNIIDNEYFGLSKSFVGSIFTTNQSFENSLQGLCQNGTVFQFGNQFCLSGTNTVNTHYMIPGDSDPLGFGQDGVYSNSSWTDELMESTHIEQTASVGPFDLTAGETVVFDFFYLTAIDSINQSETASRDLLFTQIAEIKQYFADNLTLCGDNFGLADETVNIEELTEVSMNVYPNPSNGSFTLIRDMPLNGTILISNINGELIKNIVGNGTKQQNISIDQLSTGIYFLSFQSKENHVNTLKLIVQ